MPPLQTEAGKATVAIARLFWWDSSRRTRAEATLRLLAVVAVQLSRGRASIWLSNTRRGFLSIVQHKGTDRAAIWRGLVRYLCTLLVLSPINKLYWRLLRGLRQQWDQHLTSYFLESFVDEQCIACRFRAGVVDEDGHLASSSTTSLFAPSLVEEQPDQRIAADVGKFVQLCTSLSLDMMDAIIQVSMFGALLARISPMLSYSAVLAAAMGTFSSAWLGRQLPRLYAAERYADGEFVYALTRVRENAESIAFYKGQSKESLDLTTKLARRLHTEWDRMKWRDYVQWFSSVYRQALGLLPPYMLAGSMSVAEGAAAISSSQPAPGRAEGLAPHPLPRGHPPMTLSSGTDIGIINQAREAFDEVLAPLLTFANNISDLSRLAAVALELGRLQQHQQGATAVMQEHMPETNGQQKQSQQPEEVAWIIQTAPANTTSGEPWLEIDSLTLRTPGPDHRLLLKNLTLTAPAKGGLLIAGTSGTGKTTLLRAIAGLWPAGTGSIKREMDPHRIMFLPQRPYMQLGSLRDQLLYPSSSSSGGSSGRSSSSSSKWISPLQQSNSRMVGIANDEQQDELPSDDKLACIMARLGLDHVLHRVHGDLSAVRRWTEELSLGEQQRVAVARILVHRPKYAIMDEITAANDLAHEQVMYESILETCEAVVSVGHRESLEAYHTHRLTVLGEHEEGQWRIEKLPLPKV